MTLAYIRSEIRRTFRNRRTFIFGLLMPIMFYEITSSQTDKIAGLDAAAFFMVSMATFGAVSGIFASGGRVAVERSIGWNRQLRLTSLSGRSYVLGKLATGFLTAVPSITLIYLLSVVQHGVHLSAAEWIGSALAILLATIPIGLLGIAMGYLARPESVQALSGGVFALISVLGGVWYPISDMPTWMQWISKSLPMSWITTAGRDVLQHSWIGWQGFITLVAWTLALGGLAAWAYRRDTLRV